MKKYFVLLLAVFLLQILFSFKKIIFRRGKVYYYETFFILPNCDTLAIEKVTWTPKGLPWLFQMRQQTAVTFNYIPDSLRTVNFLLPITKKNKLNEARKNEYEQNGQKWVGRWDVKNYVGAIDNKYELWIHPIRNDHFIYTEIAPFPCVEKQLLYKDSTWNSHMWYSSGYGEFSGESEELYTVKGETNYVYKNFILDSCWQINAVGHHSKRGLNFHNFKYHPEHGFIEMKYTFYDGTRIDFYMYKVTDKKHKE